jgi:hypothetical protein
MKTKSFLFLLVGLIFFIFAVSYLYFYLNGKSTIGSLVPNIFNENKKPTEAEILQAISDVKNPEPFTEQTKTDIEKALSEIKSVNGTSSEKNTNMSDVEKALAADRERDQNREALSKALQDVRN